MEIKELLQDNDLLERAAATRKEYLRSWREKNKEHVREYTREWKQRYKEQHGVSYETVAALRRAERERAAGK